MIWKFTGDEPVYQQIVMFIQGAILSGEFSPGGRFPSVRDLAAEARVNPNTMQHALQELEREGLLVTQGTVGRVVTDDPDIIAAVRNRRLQELTRETCAKYAALGLSPEDAAKRIANYQEEKE